MADLSLNLEIKGIGSTQMSMDDAKKLYNELRVLFEEKVKYVPSGGWMWNYPWWGYSYTDAYSPRTPHYKSSTGTGALGGGGGAPSSYTVKF